jgi:hypothetical protein
MRPLLLTLVCLLAGCRAPTMQDSGGRLGEKTGGILRESRSGMAQPSGRLISPWPWIDFQPTGNLFLAEGEYVAAARKFLEATYGVGNYPATQPIHLSIPDVAAEDRSKFPFVMASIQERRDGAETFGMATNTVSELAVIMSRDASPIGIYLDNQTIEMTATMSDPVEGFRKR